MGKQILHLLFAMYFIAIVGCAATKTPDGSTGHGPSATPVPEGPKPPPPPPRTPVDPKLAACRELVKTLNAPLITAVKVATSTVEGTPVEATEIKKAGQLSYRVLVQGQSRKPRAVDVGQPTVDAEKLVEPSSPIECKSLPKASEEKHKIITAMRLAQQRVPGRLVKALFGKYEDRFLYTVTVEDSTGNTHLVRVDADAQKIIKEEIVAK